jgi:phosphatidylglycerophosphatase A
VSDTLLPKAASPASDEGRTPAPGEPVKAAQPRAIIKPRRLPGDRGPAPALALTWSSFFGAGYFPVAPGTAGTAAAIPLWFALTFTPSWAYISVTVAVTLTGIAAADRAGKYYGVADSGHIVIDEVAGYLVTMLFLPRTAFAAVAGFVFFRICDVLKPWPARFFDKDPRWKNGAGVVLDDIFAALWAWGLTWSAVFLRERYFAP